MIALSPGSRWDSARALRFRSGRRIRRACTMVIDFGGEAPLPLRQAARLLPSRRAGKPTHVATLYRWAQRGLRGVRLETLQVGGTLCTSREALQRFFERLSKNPGPEAPRE